MNSKDLIVWLIPFFPLLGAILLGVFGKYLKNYSGYLGSVFIVISFILSTVIFFTVAYGHSFTSTLYSWIDASYFKVNVSTTVDRLSVIMLVMVTGISSLVHIYSIGYMKDDKGFARYFSYLNLFVF